MTDYPFTLSRVREAQTIYTEGHLVKTILDAAMICDPALFSHDEDRRNRVEALMETYETGADLRGPTIIRRKPVPSEDDLIEDIRLHLGATFVGLKGLAALRTSAYDMFGSMGKQLKRCQPSGVLDSFKFADVVSAVNNPFDEGRVLGKRYPKYLRNPALVMRLGDKSIKAMLLE